jgi:hypothetical protein
MNTKIYISYIPRLKKKELYASCIVPEFLEDRVAADDYLGWGGRGNSFIQSLVDDCGGLENWEIASIDFVEDSHSLDFNYGDKSPHQKELEKIQRQIKKLRAETKREEKKRKAAEESLAKVKEEFIVNLINTMDLTRQEAEFADVNFKKYFDKKRYFRVQPIEIKRDYAESLKEGSGQEVLEKDHKETRERIEAESQPTGKFVPVLDKFVPVHLFADYIKHLESSHTVKQHQFQEFESRRVILHERIFKAMGGERIEDHSKEIGRAIDHVIGKVIGTCICGKRSLDRNNDCVCGIHNTIEHFLVNLDFLTVER